ncbi:hypothetical protein M758_UG016300 [Ceratodon purpureus]|nr:hypothetical protein M758_UG016300 [Ceratodon purpureus]
MGKVACVSSVLGFTMYSKIRFCTGAKERSTAYCLIDDDSVQPDRHKTKLRLLCTGCKEQVAHDRKFCIDKVDKAVQKGSAFFNVIQLQATKREC